MRNSSPSLRSSLGSLVPLRTDSCLRATQLVSPLGAVPKEAQSKGEETDSRSAPSERQQPAKLLFPLGTAFLCPPTEPLRR